MCIIYFNIIYLFNLCNAEGRHMLGKTCIIRYFEGNRCNPSLRSEDLQISDNIHIFQLTIYRNIALVLYITYK